MIYFIILIIILLVIYNNNKCKHEYVDIERIEFTDWRDLEVNYKYIQECVHCGKIHKTKEIRRD